MPIIISLFAAMSNNRPIKSGIIQTYRCRGGAMNFVLNLVINAFALWAAAKAISGITYSGPWYGLLLVAVVFGVLNAFVRPVLKFLSLPFVILTLGLFIFLLNAFM